MLSLSKTNGQKEKEGRSQHRRSAKPLLNKKFYLDIKSHHTSSNLEQKLKSLGATVEYFLVKEVNYVVTDRSLYTSAGVAAGCGCVSGNTPKCTIPSSTSTPLGGHYSESPSTLDSPGDGLRGGRRSKTRAEAMLERAKLQPQQCTVNPLDNAARWSIPIWPLEKVLKWLDKIYEKYLKRSSSVKTKSSSTGLKAPFIKLETVSQNSRPVYKELSVWPTINLDFRAGGCPFTVPKVSEKKRQPTTKQRKEENEAQNISRSTEHPLDATRMTRKARSRLQRGNDTAVVLQNSAIVSGYCEICQLTFVDQKKHLQSDRHTQFVGNRNNFLSLDQLINRGPTMDTFLKLNGADQISQCPAELSGSNRRSLRSVVKPHTLSLDTSTPVSSPTAWKANQPLSPSSKKHSPVSNANGYNAARSSSSVKQSLEENSKMLLPQKDSLEVRVQCNGIWSHCYGTRHGGMKSPISGNSVRREQWDIQVGGGNKPQRVRRASASFCSNSSPSLQQQLSPTGSDSGHHLRSRGQLWLPSNLLGTTAEDEGNPARTRLGHTSADPQPARTSREMPLAKNDDDKSKTGPVVKEETKSTLCQSGNSQVIRRKRLSVEEKLIEDNKAYYKLELKNSKLRSSGYFSFQRDSEMSLKTEVKEERVGSTLLQKVSNNVKCNGEQVQEGTKVEETVAVKVQRVRKSELTLLSDEAECFMFGEPLRRESSTQSSEEEEDEEQDEKKESKSKLHKNLKKESLIEESNVKRVSDNKKSVKKKEDDGSTQVHQSVAPPLVVHSKIDGENGNQCNMLQCDESSVCSMDACSLASSCDTNSATRQKRKRRTHAEAFIHDNLDYYKFEIPGSRLRFQGSILPPTVASVENNAVCNSDRGITGSKDTAGVSSCSKSDSPSTGEKATCNGAPSKVMTCSNEVTNEREKIVNTQEESKQKVVGENENKSGKRQEREDDRKEEEQDKSNVRETVENDLQSAMDRLHFSFEVVPQSEPWYQTYTRQDEGEEFYAYSCMSDSCYWKPFLLPYELSSSESLAFGSGCPGGGAGSSGLVRRRRNRFAHLLDKKPRKSPRCHASTLAILSSLMHHRKRKESGRPKEEVQKSETGVINCAEEDSVSRDAPSVSIDVPSTSSPTTSPLAALSVESVAVIPGSNSDFKSESDPDLHEIARNIDRMFNVGSEAEEVIGSDFDTGGDESKQEISMTQKVTDSNNFKPHIGKKNVQHQNRKCPNFKVRNLDLHLPNQHENLEIDPTVLDELHVETSVVSPVEHYEYRCRGGPKIDVVTLLNEFSACQCMDEPAVISKERTGCQTNPSLLGESSCNSSECGASSTCETITFSDGPDGRIMRIHGRKRKRKKNLTGWPADKQKGKRRLLSKLSRVDDSVVSGDDTNGKCVNVSHKSHLSVEEGIATASEVNKSGCGRVEDGTGETVMHLDECERKFDSMGFCRGADGVKVVSNFPIESPVVKEKRVSGLSRTGSLDSTGHSSLEYQPCVRVTKIPDVAGVTVASLPISSSSSCMVAGISNNRRLRSSSLSSSSPATSVPVSKSSIFLSSDSFKRPGGSSQLKRRASPRKCLSRSSMQWSTWSARKRR